MRASLLALWLPIAVGGCTPHQPTGELTTLRIERIDGPKDARAGRVWTVDEQNPIATDLAGVLSRCHQREIVKFRSKYRVIAHRGDGTAVTFNVLRDLVKIEGIAFRCERNVQELIERL